MYAEGNGIIKGHNQFMPLVLRAFQKLAFKKREGVIWMLKRHDGKHGYEQKEVEGGEDKKWKGKKRNSCHAVSLFCAGCGEKQRRGERIGKQWREV